MTHQHEITKIYTDEESKGTIAEHQLPVPMGWKILIQPNQIKQQTKGGIILPSKAQENEAYLTAHGRKCCMVTCIIERKTGASGRYSNRPKSVIE